MATPKRYPPELRERAVRMVAEHRRDYPSEWATIRSIAEKFGMKTETLRLWVRRAQIDTGQRPGTTSEQHERIQQLERENRELRRANEILTAASAFFARELDPRLPNS
jgi:transposase